MFRCPACLLLKYTSYNELSSHILDSEKIGSAEHIMWLNRNLSSRKLSQAELSKKLEGFFRADRVKQWVISIMIKKFFGESPHPFIVAMQHPSRKVLLGYVYEHHHFLKQWVRSCSLIIGNTENEDVQFFEIENILSEWFGIPGKQQAHHELLIKMGESYGASRTDIYNTIPLNATKRAI